MRGFEPCLEHVRKPLSACRNLSSLSRFLSVSIIEMLWKGPCLDIYVFVVSLVQKGNLQLCQTY